MSSDWPREPYNPPTPANRRGNSSEKKCRDGANYKCRTGAKYLSPTSDMKFCSGAARLSRLRPGLYKLLFEEIKKGALQAILLGGSEGDVRSTQAFCCGEAL